jgi:type I restriction enzyme, S subunit
MTRGFDPHVPLRASCIPWLGEIPAHWGVWKVGHFAAVGNGSTPSRDNAGYWTEGLIPWLNSSVVNQDEVTEADQFITETAFRECHLPLVKSGSVLVGITGQGKTRGQAAVLSFEATINQHLAFITPKKGVVDPWFLRWALFAAYDFLRSISDDAGGTKGALTCEEVGALRMPLPPIDEQCIIADYLNRETARLDGLVAEKRQALITRAVTRGLDSRTPLRDSGIPWLGEIPAYWSTERLRWLISSIEQGWSPEAENREPKEDEWAVLKLNAVAHGQFNPSAAKALPVGLQARADLEVHPGDFLITRANTPALVGDVCFVMEARPLLMLCDLIYRLRLCDDRLDGQYLSHFFTSPKGREQIESDARGTSNSMVKISQEHIKNWWLPLPPIDEQRAIVAHIATETAKLDTLRAATECTIALLKEHRAALIAAAVTGKINVQGEIA